MDNLRTKKRFRDKVRVTPSGCWEWTAAKHPKGYGMFSVEGRSVYAHRYFWELINGPIPIGFEIDHLCNNKSCVRIDHLDCTTRGENMKRAAKNSFLIVLFRPIFCPL